ncbi:CRE-LGC-9 protein [Caenorhabditis remanei]|uniref:CRE-LGC-9 protein n=2 Tax=Caenorhabditis TaxID=6237 RepID=E3NEV4_CAERE|nr:CRE-LGC-9 protein [Caenorhabditis remanei]
MYFLQLISVLISMKVGHVRSSRLLQHNHNYNDDGYVKAEPTHLIETIQRRYDKRVRPFAETNRPVIVHMTIVLGILTEVRENQQVASFVISHVQKWRDPKLAWNPADHSGLTQVVMPRSLVWVPKLFIYNSMDTKDMLTDDRYDVRIQHTGHVKVNSPQFVSTLCRINIDLFPFDTQFCAIALASPLLSVEEMDVNATQPPVDSYFSGNAEWQVMNVTVKQMKFMEEGEYRAEVHYILHLNRRPTYYITVIVVPTFLISALSILGIFSPGSNDGPRNEKVSLGLGSLLAMTVLLDIVAGAMPKSDAIPLLGYYIMLVILLCAIGVAVSMAMLSMSRSCIQTSKMPPPHYYRLLFLNVCRVVKQNGVNSGVPMNEKPTTITPRFPDLISIYNQLIEVARAQRTYRERIEKQKWQHRVEIEWNKIFARVDFFFLFLFEMFNVLVLVLFLRYAFLPVPPLPDNFSI